MSNKRSLIAAAGIISASAGALALAAIAPGAQAQARGDAAKGKAVFARCGVCHSVDPAQKKMGPTLANVVNRRAGTIAGFKYSPAMKGSKMSWTAQNLDKFLAAPRTVVPGTSMASPPVANAADRANLIAYLSSVSKPAKK